MKSLPILMNLLLEKLKCPIQKIENTITSIIKVLIEACKNSVSNFLYK